MGDWHSSLTLGKGGYSQVFLTMKNVEIEDEEKTQKLSGNMVSSKCSDVDIDHALLVQRFSRNELVLRFLSLVCLCFMFGLFLIQLDILWRSRESLIMEMLLKDTEQFYFHYPEFYDTAHNEETWCWDPDTLLLKVNTSFFVH